MKMQKMLLVLGIIAALTVPALADPVPPVYYPVSAGQIFAAGDDDEPGHFNDMGTFYMPYNFAAGTHDPESINMILDLGAVIDVDAFLIQNRTDTSTNLAIGQMEIYVAPDETDPGFDFTDIDHYTVKVYGSASPDPTSGAAGEIRTADIDNTAARYFQLRILTPVSGSLVNLQFSDIDVVPVPEPATMCMLALGGLLALKRRKA